MDQPDVQSRLNRVLNKQVIVTTGQVGVTLESSDLLPCCFAVGDAPSYGHVWAA